MTARILLVDDHRGMLAQVGRLLREEGYEVTSTDSPADAICLLNNNPPDLLMLDLLMPGMDGDVVLRQLGATRPAVILMTGAVVHEKDFDATKVDRVLAKPFDDQKLLATVREVLAGNPLSDTKDELIEQRERDLDRIRQHRDKACAAPNGGQV